MPASDSDPTPSVKTYPLRDLDKFTSIEAASPTSDWKSGLPIAIDLGSYHTRIGYTSQSEPSHEFFTQVSKFRERRQNKSYTLVGNDIYLDSTARQTIKSPFDGPFISNFDVVETIFDYSFSKLSVGSEDGLENPIVLSEIIGCPEPQRKSMNELLFEGYNVPSVTYGIDSLFSYYYNNKDNYNDDTGLVVSCGYESTNIIPVLNGKGLLSQSKRINWGGKQSSNYLQALLSLKYPYFPLKISSNQATLMVQDYCYISKDYEEEVSSYLDFSTLAEKERIIQAPFTEIVVQEKSEEELQRIAEQRKESGRRLQEQAQKKRLEKLIQQEEELKYYNELKVKVVNLKTNRKEIKRLLDSDGIKDENNLQKIISDLEKAIRKGRKQDVGEEEVEEAPKFPLVDIADEELNDEEIKEKKKQRLLKASYEARLRAKEEKLLEEKRIKEEERKDAEWRETDLEGWIKDRREKLDKILANKREKQRLRDELSNRKSLASQMRMKSIAALASESKGGNKRRRQATGIVDDDPDDTFGANDDDWAVYRRIANASDSEEEEEETSIIKSLQDQLLKYDSTFSIEDTQEAQLDWRKSTIHLFLRGPHEFDPESRAQSHQINLNIERIRVPEVLFQPSIAGVDQAGIVEICGDIFSRNKNIPYANNIFLHGGLANFDNFEPRLLKELKSLLPVGTPLSVKRASNLSYDAWRGMAKFSKTEEFKSAGITREDYLEMGGGYIKEHRLGNSLVR